VRAARGRKARLIVMGTHGRTGVARFFLGSVAARVAATAPCPVLTVRRR
jgi:nucleotide-binding universal stress UspA family protein